jgi:hypothetical protein
MDIEAPEAPRLFSLRLGIYPPLQVLQPDGRLYHLAPASHVVGGVTDSRVPWLPGCYPASPLLRTPPPPSRLRPTSRCARLYGLPCSADFATGHGGFLQLRNASWSPCCHFHPAGVTDRLSQITIRHVAFTLRLQARPPGCLTFGATAVFACATAR